jgi:serine/threonine protein kinase
MSEIRQRRTRRVLATLDGTLCRMFVCSECGASQPMAGGCGGCGGLTMAGSEDPLLGASVGPYRIARLLGVGGMGRVYKGVQPQIGSRVAVKVLSRECTDRKDLVERFFSEARAVNLIRHESIVNVLDLAMLPDGRPYIVMEYLDGAPLSDLIARAIAARGLGPMPLGGTARLAVEVLDALGAAHAKGIVHRDLKPDNVFITPAGRAKVLDFGIAKLLPELGGSFTQTGSLLGTPHYMSPEQASGKNIDFRTDLYAMGVILFECATGHKPFVGDSMFDLLRKHVDVPPPLPRSLRPDLPPAYEHVILTALAKDPNHRFPSAAAMASALQQATSGMAPEQWAAISGASGGSTQPSPSGAGWSTPASWGGASRAAVVSPRSGGTPTPGAPLYDMPQSPLPSGHPPGAPYPWPALAPPHLQRPPSTATAGQVVGGKKGGGKALWAVLGLLVVGGGIAAAVVGGSSSGGSSTTTAAVGSGSGSSAVQPAMGSDGSESHDDEDANSAVDSGGGDKEPPAVLIAKGDQAGSDDDSVPELRELEELLASLPEEQRAMVRQQFAQMEQQIKALPPEQRAMVTAQLRNALVMSKAQMTAARVAMTANPTTPDGDAPAASGARGRRATAVLAAAGRLGRKALRRLRLPADRGGSGQEDRARRQAVPHRRRGGIARRRGRPLAGLGALQLHLEGAGGPAVQRAARRQVGPQVPDQRLGRGLGHRRPRVDGLQGDPGATAALFAQAALAEDDRQGGAPVQRDR